MKDIDDTLTTVADFTMQVNDALLTRTIIKYLGSRVVIQVDHNNRYSYHFPDSTCDLLVYADGTWAPVTGAFEEDGHLYIIVGFGQQGEYLYSPTAPNIWRQVPYGYDPEVDGTLHEFFVNPLFDDCIARIYPMDDSDAFPF